MKGSVGGFPGIGPSPPYLMRPDRAGGDLLDSQGLLQLGAERGAVVAAAARPRPPVTQSKRRVTGEPPAAFWGSGESRGPTCRATPEAATDLEPPPPWPGVERREGWPEGAGSAERGAGPAPAPGTAEECPGVGGGDARGRDPTQAGCGPGSPNPQGAVLPWGLSPLGPASGCWSSMERKENKRNRSAEIKLRWYFTSKFGKLKNYT